MCSCLWCFFTSFLWHFPFLFDSQKIHHHRRSSYRRQKGGRGGSFGPFPVSKYQEGRDSTAAASVSHIQLLMVFIMFISVQCNVQSCICTASTSGVIVFFIESERERDYVHTKWGKKKDFISSWQLLRLLLCCTRILSALFVFNFVVIVLCVLYLHTWNFPVPYRTVVLNSLSIRIIHLFVLFVNFF